MFLDHISVFRERTRVQALLSGSVAGGRVCVAVAGQIKLGFSLWFVGAKAKTRGWSMYRTPIPLSTQVITYSLTYLLGTQGRTRGQGPAPSPRRQGNALWRDLVTSGFMFKT